MPNATEGPPAPKATAWADASIPGAHVVWINLAGHLDTLTPAEAIGLHVHLTSALADLDAARGAA